MTAASYKTKQRDQIMDYLVKNKDRHITADEMIKSLNAEKSMVGRTTVYRYLDKLVSDGILRRYFVEEGKSACYQLMGQNGACSRHYHLKCLDCGQLFHLECDYLGEMDAHIRELHDFHVDHSKTVLYGQCGACTGNPAQSNSDFRKPRGHIK